MTRACSGRINGIAPDIAPTQLEIARRVMVGLAAARIMPRSEGCCAHRECMRVMDDIIQEEGLEEQLEERVVAETGNTSF